jgi:probable selenium-dependent hydroxylase accessory protein YqeC
MMEDILDVFSAKRGIISVAGAGGKKSTMHRLVTAHTGSVAVTSTVHTPRYRRRLNIAEIVCDQEDLLVRVKEAAKNNRRIAYAQPSEKPARLRGVDPEMIYSIHEQIGFEATIVKADGARLRLLKAPDHNSPVLPLGTNVLVSVLSIRVVGKPLSEEIAHHAPEVARAMGIEVGEVVEATHLARLLSTDYGVLDGADDIRLIPVLNMVENKEDLKLGRLIAEQALASSSRFDRVVLASMIQDNPVKEVIGD